MNWQQRLSEGSQSVIRGTKKSLADRKTIDVRKIKGPEAPLYTAVCPVVYVIRVFGLAPYEFHKDFLVPSSINSMYALLCLTTYTYIIYTVLMSFVGKKREKPLLGLTEAAKVRLV